MRIHSMKQTGFMTSERIQTIHEPGEILDGETSKTVSSWPIWRCCHCGVKMLLDEKDIQLLNPRLAKCNSSNAPKIGFLKSMLARLMGEINCKYK